MRTDLFLTIFSVFILNNLVFSQGVVPISDEGSVTINDCASGIVITDSNADDGNYGVDEDFLITICLSENLPGPLVAIISPELYGHIWDVDENATLSVFDGADADDVLLGNFHTAEFPEGMAITATGHCITIQFTSSDSGTGAGFEMDVLCAEFFENEQPFFVQLTTNPPLQWDESIGTHVMNVCEGETFSASISLEFPFDGLNYPQSTESTMIKWAFGGQSIYRGLGLTSVDHVYDKPNGSKVIIDVTDSVGFNHQYVFYVRTSAKPNFSISVPDGTAFCTDQAVEISGGIESGEVVGASAISNGFQLHAFYGQELYLPDGSGTNYQTDILVSGFDEGQTLSEGDILQSLCVNMEHSYLGDLEMMFTCPDGTSAIIFNSYAGYGLFPAGFGGGSTFLGDAYDDDSSPDQPGIGFNYCFGSDTEWGTLGEEHAAENTIPVNGFPPGGNAMSPGIYLPEETFETFIGCPLNGLWTLTVRDNIGSDNGFLFDWGIVFDIQAGPDSLMYESPLLSAIWEENDMIVEDNGSSIIVLPTLAQPEDLVFKTTDVYGCNFTDTLDINFIPQPDAIEASETCGLVYELPVSFPEGTWDLVSTTSGSNEISFFNLPDGYVAIEVGQPGEYLVSFTEPECNYQMEVLVTYLEENDPACVLSSSSVIKKDRMNLSPNPAFDKVNINFSLAQNAMVQVDIISIDGRIMKREQFQSLAGEQDYQITVGGIGAGIYQLRFSTGTEFISQPLVISR